jgi:hypothetical protein
MTVTSTTSARIAELNDAFRRSHAGRGRQVVSAGIAALSIDQQAAIIAQVRAFGAFTSGNDPHGEHDFGSFEHAGARIFWKIDAYADDDMTVGANDPTRTDTFRVLTIMLADEY